jgi:DNA-binding transcriptional regulator YhcF (GntR family)
MKRGYIKLWRKTLDNNLLKNPVSFTLFAYMLLESANCRQTIKTKNGYISINQGELISSSRRLAKVTGTTRMRIRTALNILKSANIVTTRSVNNLTIYSIVNWSTYQNDECNKDDNTSTTENAKPATSKQEDQDIKIPPCPHKDIIERYNLILGSHLPQVKIKLWGGQRKRLLTSRWKEDKERQNLAWWEWYFNSINSTPFLIGENDKGWTVDLEWIIRPTNMVKILEGKYGHITEYSKSKGTNSQTTSWIMTPDYIEYSEKRREILFKHGKEAMTNFEKKYNRGKTYVRTQTGTHGI